MEIKEIMALLEQILDEHPEYQPAVELFMMKMGDFISGDALFLREMVIRGVRPGSDRTQ